MGYASDQNSCKMTAKWDYATSGTTGKYSESREIFRLNSVRYANSGNSEDDYDFKVIETKNKVRGNGSSLKLRFESTTGKDFEILEWATEMTGATGG